MAITFSFLGLVVLSQGTTVRTSVLYLNWDVSFTLLNNLDETLMEILCSPLLKVSKDGCLIFPPQQDTPMPLHDECGWTTTGNRLAAYGPK